MDADRQLPAAGSRVRCIDNTDRPELQVGREYVVDIELFLSKMPINYNRYQPVDFRLITIKIPEQKENGIFPFGLFEVV